MGTCEYAAFPITRATRFAALAGKRFAKEKKIAGPLLVSSIILFYAGVAFAYYIVFPLVFGFFTSIGPENVKISTDIRSYLDFILALFFGFGLAFEVPIATIILVAIGFTTPKKLAETRPFIIVGAFIIGMLLTPPDVISQVLLALPMWVLFEAGLIAPKIIFRDRLLEDEEYDDDYDDEPMAETATAGAADNQTLSEEEMSAEADSSGTTSNTDKTDK